MEIKASASKICTLKVRDKTCEGNPLDLHNQMAEKMNAVLLTALFNG